MTGRLNRHDHVDRPLHFCRARRIERRSSASAERLSKPETPPDSSRLSARRGTLAEQGGTELGLGDGVGRSAVHLDEGDCIFGRRRSRVHAQRCEWAHAFFATHVQELISLRPVPKTGPELSSRRLSPGEEGRADRNSRLQPRRASFGLRSCSQSC